MRSERLTNILAKINEMQSVNIKTLMQLFYASEATIRRDLKTLEEDGLIIRSHGRALRVTTKADATISFANRKQTAKAQKISIAKKAVSDCVKEDCVVMLDASSTAMETVDCLKKYKDVIVMTSGIETLLHLAQTDLKYYSSGGQAFNKSYSFIGQTAIDTIKTMNADVCFVSCHGLSENGYATDNSVFENDVRKAILTQSRKKVLLIDSTKINKNCYSNLCHVSFFDDAYCDKGLPAHIQNQVKRFHLVCANQEY